MPAVYYIVVGTLYVSCYSVDALSVLVCYYNAGHCVYCGSCRVYRSIFSVIHTVSCNLICCCTLGLAAPQYDHNMMELRTHQASRSVKVSSSNVSTTSSSSSIQVLKVRLEYQQELDLVQAQLETLQVEINKLERALDEEKNDKELIGQDMRRLEHQYRTAKREREEAIVELDQRVKERYDMQQQLEETLRDLDEVTAKNDGLNMQLQQFGVVMKDRDEALVELEKIKKQRDQAISDRKNLAERKAKVESELESTLLRYEEAIKESEGKGEEQKTLTRELTRMQMQKMELQLENSKLRKDVREAVDVHAARERGVASPRDSGVSGDMVRQK